MTLRRLRDLLDARITADPGSADVRLLMREVGYDLYQEPTGHIYRENHDGQDDPDGAYVVIETREP
ncbi:hypothetical protein [Nocardiopsis gilva]|nr:hypothetical protein [Nocardiopsis gilva]